MDCRRRGWKWFSIRFLLILIAVMCIYLACWEPTRRLGVNDVYTHLYGDPYQGETPGVKALVPLVVRADDLHRGRQGYYVWVFGSVTKLPLETDLVFNGVTGAT